VCLLAEYGEEAEGGGRFADVLAPLLREKAPELRAVAAAAMGETGGDAALARVRELFSDRDRWVRMHAAYAATMLGDGSRLEEVGEVLAAGPRPARRVAASLLGRLLERGVPAGADAARLLVAGLDAPQADVRSVTARALGRKADVLGGAAAEVTSALAGRRSDPDGGVRAAAAKALGRIASVESVEVLAAFTRDREVEVKTEALGALGRSGLAEAVRHAAAGLGDFDRSVQRAACLALAELTGEAFGLRKERSVYTDEEVNAAVLRAQTWWHEHAVEYEGR
jgi:HEAT repeat protein